MRQSSYFSIDYRSPPSGVGQIVPEGATHAKEMILITAGDDGAETNPYYRETLYFPHNLWEEETRDEARKFFEDLFTEHGVNHVYDSEMGYNFDVPPDMGFNHSTGLWLDTLFGRKS